MGLFSRKKQQAEAQQLKEEREALLEELAKPPCQRKGGKHMWRDFPPVLTYDWNGKGTASNIRIEEYYVCALCGKKVTETLESWTYKNYSYEKFFSDVHAYQEKYKDFIKPQAIVNDMVNDAIRVDRQRLYFWDKIHSPEMAQEPEERDIGELIDPSIPYIKVEE